MTEKNAAAVALGRLGGLAKSARKAASSRANGQAGGHLGASFGHLGGSYGHLGGRPPKMLQFDVYLHGKCIGHTEGPPGSTPAEARQKLLDENGLDPRIVVRPQPRAHKEKQP